MSSHHQIGAALAASQQFRQPIGIFASRDKFALADRIEGELVEAEIKHCHLADALAQG